MLPYRRLTLPTLGAALLLGSALAAPPARAANTAKATDVPEQVTWAEHVAPLVYRNCSSCHRPGDIAPMSLLSYDEARPWAKSMAKAVHDRVMPPWHADREFGEFSNDRSLSDDEVALIERWVRQGAPAGDLERAPAPPTFDDEGWRLGEPDLVLSFEQVDLPAGGPDQFRDLVADPGVDGNRWIRAIELKPGDRRVVHHVILYAQDPNGGPPASGWLAAWAAGMAPMEFPPGTAKLLPAGNKLIGDMHYHPTTEPASDVTRVGIYFYDGEPQKELINLWVQNASFKIPAGDPDHVVQAAYTFPQDSTVYGLLPHMHYRGKEFTYTAVYPDGRRETLLHVPRYDFNWQTLYELQKPLEMPKGTRIECVAHYDNSTDNKANPDPTRDVTFGNESYDEMMIGFVDYVVDQGQRPPTVEEQVTRALGDLVSSHPGEVWAVTVTTPGGEMQLPTALHLASQGEGLWLIPMNGQMQQGTVRDIVRDGANFTATLAAPFGTMAIAGVIDAGTIHGKVTLEKMALDFEGKAATSPQ